MNYWEIKIFKKTRKILILVISCIAMMHFCIIFSIGNINYTNTLKTEYKKDFPEKGLQTINTDWFTIITPNGWKHYTGYGNDNVIGGLLTNDWSLLHYDYTFAGGANSLVDSEEEVIIQYIRNDYFDCIEEKYFKKKDYVKILKTRLSCHHEHFDYIAKVNICDSTIDIKYKLNEKTLNHNVEMILINGIEHKIVFPKDGENGLTGIYYGGRRNFWGKDLDINTQAEVIRALKTVKWKDSK